MTFRLGLESAQSSMVLQEMSEKNCRKVYSTMSKDALHGTCLHFYFNNCDALLYVGFFIHAVDVLYVTTS